MLGKAVLVVLQTLLFLLVFGFGSFLPAFSSFPNWQVHTAPNRAFVLDGVLLMIAVYVLILALEAVGKRLRGHGGLTTLALVLALALGFAMKLGFRSV